MKHCQKCNAEVLESHVFCPFCGEELTQPDPKERLCPNCNSIVESTHSFCPFCGAKVESLIESSPHASETSFCVCPNCLASVDSSLDNCPMCNTSLTSTNFSSSTINYTQSTNSKRDNGLHCPTCKSKSITPLNEMNIDGGAAINYGRFSSISVSATNKLVWACSECGTKFRSIQSVESDYRKANNGLVFFKISFFLMVAAIIFFVFIMFMFDLFLLMPFALLAVFAAFLMLIFWLVFASKTKKLEAELEYLQIECFY